ncbi:GNAT family N-acetyltransferase [Bacillus hwajinpoensis]|uniref:GNAT family N-acetyltransferase n=1 Tax=Guptibacillus hwajinpoensis TaxID=208199 RepID=A0A845F2H4_9BACL|nr:GNAT family N-acetyltransferase [Pseudalkalibacillus hwajinpoensis]MYL65143.1 GNAT family N-acetyltransferase [Pseudalkalibacillus hwajinpoensis]
MDTIRILQSIDFEDSILDTFERKQETTKVLVVESNSLNEKEDRFVDDWTIERKREIVNHFKSTIASGGAVIVAEQGSKVLGFAVIEAKTFGERSTYRELSYIHTSLPYRGMGIGRRLFVKAKEVAKQLGVEKLYIGAHPSVETQRFYKSMGCMIAKEMNCEIYERETRDIQLEITL